MGSVSLKFVFTLLFLLCNRTAEHTPPDFERAFEKCRTATTCTECLATYTAYGYKDEHSGYRCGFMDGECWLGGVGACTWQAKMPQEFEEADDDIPEEALAVAQQQCTEYQVNAANEAVCKENDNCQDCQKTELAVGDGFCLWYDAAYGESFCASASKNPADTPVIDCSIINESNISEVVDDDEFWSIENEKCENATKSCTDCVTTLTAFGYACAYSHGECALGGFAGGYQASILPCSEYGNLETVANKSCSAYEARKANEAACTPIEDCNECLATEMPAGYDHGKSCQWFPNHGGYCASYSYHESEVPVENCSGGTSLLSIAQPTIQLFFGGLFLLSAVFL